MEVLALLADGKSNAQISALTGAKIATVEKHIENIYPKLGVNSRTDAAIWFYKREIVKLKNAGGRRKR